MLNLQQVPFLHQSAALVTFGATAGVKQAAERVIRLTFGNISNTSVPGVFCDVSLGDYSAGHSMPEMYEMLTQ